MSIILDLSRVDREIALRTWLIYHGLEVKSLASALGVHPGTVTRIIKGERTPRDTLDRLVAMGIPRELLPVPGPGPGRPPSD